MSAPVSDDGTVLWHTWSGRLHKFGPSSAEVRMFGSPHRPALCNSSIFTDELTQRDRTQTTVCKRCFPDGDPR